MNSAYHLDRTFHLEIENSCLYFSASAAINGKTIDLAISSQSFAREERSKHIDRTVGGDYIVELSRRNVRHRSVVISPTPTQPVKAGGNHSRIPLKQLQGLRCFKLKSFVTSRSYDKLSCATVASAAHFASNVSRYGNLAKNLAACTQSKHLSREGEYPTLNCPRPVKRSARRSHSQTLYQFTSPKARQMASLSTHTKSRSTCSIGHSSKSSFFPQ